MSGPWFPNIPTRRPRRYWTPSKLPAIYKRCQLRLGAVNQERFGRGAERFRLQTEAPPSVFPLWGMHIRRPAREEADGDVRRLPRGYLGGSTRRGCGKAWLETACIQPGRMPGPDLHYISYQTRTPNSDCDKFHDGATQAIRDLHPDAVIVTSIGGLLLDGSWPSSTQWRDAWVSMFQKLTQPGTRLVLLANVPSWKNDDARCLAAHTNDVQNCSAPVAEATEGGAKAGPAGTATQS